jgi:hypothetical protein
VAGAAQPARAAHRRPVRGGHLRRRGARVRGVPTRRRRAGRRRAAVAGRGRGRVRGGGCGRAPGHPAPGLPPLGPHAAGVGTLRPTIGCRAAREGSGTHASLCQRAVGLGWVVTGCLPSQRAWLAVRDMRSGRAPAIAHLRREGHILSRALYCKARACVHSAGPCPPRALLCAVLAAMHCQRLCLLRALQPELQRSICVIERTKGALTKGL